MSVDPWVWGVEETTDSQDWNNGWSNPDFQANSKNASSFATSPGAINANNNTEAHASNQRNTVWKSPDEPQSHPPNSSAASYFSGKAPLNNNPYGDVENKEIAPPDLHQQPSENRQPMKLGNKQIGDSLRNTMSRPESGSQFGNMEHVTNAPSFQFAPENHHQLHQQSFNQAPGSTTARNQTHHYFGDNQKDFLQGHDSTSRSYFDQMGGPPSLLPHQPSVLLSEQPQSLSSEQSQLPPTNFFQDRNNRHTQQQTQSMKYFQMQEQMVGNAQYFKSNNSVITHPIQLPQEVSQMQDNGVLHKLDSINIDEIGTSVENEMGQLKNKELLSNQQLDDRPPPYILEDVPPDYSQQLDSQPAPASQESIAERSGPLGFEEPDKRHPWNRAMPPPPQPQPVGVEYLESRDRKKSSPMRDNMSGSQEWPIQNPLLEKPVSREWLPPPPVTQKDHRPSERAGSLPPQVDKPTSRDRSIPPPPPIQLDKAGREWSASHSTYPTDRPGSQGQDRSGQYSSERTGSHENIGHQRTESLGSDRSGSVGKDRSSSDRSGSSVPRNNANYRKDLPGGASRGESNMIGMDSTKVRSKNKSTRPDGVPSRSPGAGEDRSSPPSRPDNLESLPPESHLTQRMNHLSLQPSFDKDDCPLDRNEYLETSQLSNQETVETDIRSSRLPSTDSTRNSHRGERREVVGEAEPLGGRVVLGHTTPTTTPPPTQHHSDEVEGGGSGSMERMVLGERREQTSRNNRSSRRIDHRRESSYEEEDQDYSSDNRRGHRDDGRRDERHRNKRAHDHRSSDYMSDDDYEIDRRVYSRRDRRGRERDRDYEPDYRRDYYRDDPRSAVRRGRGYYGYDDDDFSYRERSRPSSRSGSDYRRTNLDYQSRNQSRHYYNPSLSGVLGGREYETNPEYFEYLRKNNPVLYAFWYQDYMRKLQDTAVHSAFTQSDRASIHSGQSSGNRLHVSTTPSQVLESNVGNVDSFEDYSPRLFSTPHVRGSFDGQGRLLVVNAASPLDGQQASVQVLSLEASEEDPTIKEFLHSPSPFIPGVTHRSTVIQYLRKMSDQAGKSSEKLIYDLVHLIVKSNGKPDASDISELLLDNYRNSKGDSKDQWDPDPSLTQPISHQEMLSTFRNLLHQGNKQEALEWAMKHGGWGHALFLSSKMDARTQSRVASEFASSLCASDPLSTLYQVMSGSIPAAARACSDRRWADWRPHLAMVLSNLTGKVSTDLATVTTLAEGLASRGRLCASHSCHIIAQVMFGEAYKSEGPVLLGCSEPVQSMQQPQQLSQSFNYKSFLLTLCYEYAIKQSQINFFIPSLQRYKLLVAWRLVEWGRGRQALLYCELLASELLHSTGDGRLNATAKPDLVHLLVDLSSGLKALDPTAPIDLSTVADPEWLQQLRQLAASLPLDEIDSSVGLQQPPSEPANYSNFEAGEHVTMYRTGGGMDSGSAYNNMRLDDPPNLNITDSVSNVEPPTSSSTPSKASSLHQPIHSMKTPLQPMQPNMQHSLPPAQPLQPIAQPSSMPHIPSYTQPTFSSQPLSFTGYDDVGTNEGDRSSEPVGVKSAVWTPEKTPDNHTQPTNKPSTSYFHASENLLQDVKESSKTAPKPATPAQTGTKAEGQKNLNGGNSGGGWFNGILGKFSIKPKNQMILPDDDDPKIVYDSNLNKWVDKDSIGSDAAKELKPPPMGGAAMSSGNPGLSATPMQMPLGNPSIPPTNPGMANKYKLQKGKSMKSNYVDILSNSGSSSKVSGSMEPMMPCLPAHSHPDPSNNNYFLPQSGDGSDNKGQQAHHDNNYQGQAGVHGMPMMYNAANF